METNDQDQGQQELFISFYAQNWRVVMFISKSALFLKFTLQSDTNLHSL